MENQYDKADESFRSVVNLRGETFPADYAKWSLGYLRQRRQTAEAFHGIEQQIDAILKGRK